MKISREKHLTYITKLMPLLLIAYIVQCYFYWKWAPREIASDVAIFVAFGLVGIALAFTYYNQFHVVTLHRNHLSFGMKHFGEVQEILYRDIQNIDIQVSKHAFYNVTLSVRDGREVKLWYLDDVQDLKALVKAA